MSDDSEKIAGMAIMSMARDIDEKDAEIERLRGELDALQTHFDIKAKLGVEKDAEIERLREANIRHNAWFQEEVERRAAAERKQHAAEAEIERLRLDLSNCETRLKWHDETLAERDAVIERLREGLRARTANCDAKAKEIERLQRTVNDLKSGWQSTYDHDTNWLKSEIERLRREHEKAWADAQLKAAEIERLRKLKEHPYPRERTWSDCEAELQQLRDELAREKQEHDITRTFHDIAVKERNYERVLALKRDEEIERLRGFARRVLRAWPEGDIDGGELQDAAIEAGLLVKVDPPPSEPCGERCSCADYYAPEDFASGDVVCYRRVREALGDA